YHITVDGNSTIAIWNDITNAGEFSVAEGSNLTLDFANGVGNTYKFAQMNSQNSTKYYLDVDFKTKNFDQFIVQNGSGTIYIAGLNLLNDLPNMSVTLQILQAGAAAASNGMRIDIDPNILKQYSTSGSNQTRTEYTTAIGDTIYWSQALGTRVVTYNYSSSLALSKTGSTYDSLTYTYNENILSEKTTLVDALRLYAKYNDDLPVKHFISTGSDSVYNVTEDFIDNGVAEIVKGVLYVTGELSGANEITSTINANSHKMFTLDAASRLNIENVRITGLKNEDGAFITNNGGGVTLINTTVGDKQSAAGAKAAIINNSDNFTIGVNSNSSVNTVTLNQSLIGAGSMTVNEGATLVVGNYANLQQSKVDVAGIMNAEMYATLNTPINITNTGVGNFYAGNIKNTIANSGTLNVLGYSSKSLSDSNVITGSIMGNGVVQIGSGNGTEYISNTGTINSALFLASRANFYTDIENLKNKTTGTYKNIELDSNSYIYINSKNTDSMNLSLKLLGNESANIYLTGNFKTLDGTITYSGLSGYYKPELTFGDNMNIKNNIVLNTSTITIPATSTLTTNPENLRLNNPGSNKKVQNAGVLNFIGGTSSTPAVLRYANVGGSGTTNIGSASTPAYIQFVETNVLAYGFYNKINIFAGSSLTAYAEYLKNIISNSGNLTLTGGSLNYEISGAGNTIITGSVSSNVKVANKVTVNSGATYTASANNILNAVVNNGSLVFTGGTFNQQLTGTGTISLLGDVLVKSGTTINQYFNTGDKWFKFENADDLLVSGNGRLQFFGGTVNVTTNTYTYFYNTVYIGSKANVGNLITQGSAKVYTSADNFNFSESMAANSHLYLTGGTLRNTIGSSVGQGNGLVHITGDVKNTNNSIINSNLIIDEGGTFTSNFSPLAIQKTVTNNGTFLVSGTLNRHLYGSGVTKINGSLLVDENGIIDGTLNFNGGTLNLADLVSREFNVGKVTGTGNITLDLDATTKKSDKLIISDKTSDAKITITNVNLTLSSVNDLVSGITFQILTGGSKSQLILPQSVIDKAKTALPIAIRTEDTISKAYKDDGTEFSFVDSSGNVNVSFNDAAKYGIRVKNGTGNATLSLATTQSTNDSLKLSITGTNWTTNQFTKKDLLEDFLTYSTNKEKTFRFNTTTDNYTTTHNYDVTNITTKTNIVGLYDSSANKISQITLGGRYLQLDVKSGASLNISNIYFQNLRYLSYGWGDTLGAIMIQAGATGNFENVRLSGFSQNYAHFINNLGTIKNISGYFYSNSSSYNLIKNRSGGVIKNISIDISSSGHYGNGRILNHGGGKIGYIENGAYKGGITNSHFWLNLTPNCYNYVVICNSGDLYNISDNYFIRNYNYSNSSGDFSSVALGNTGYIFENSNNIFYGNYATKSDSDTLINSVNGIALYNSGRYYLGLKDVSVISNYAIAYGTKGIGLYNNGIIGYNGYNNKSIDRNVYYGNYATFKPQVSKYGQGAGIWNSGTITYGITNSVFSGNYITSVSSSVNNANYHLEGGAIYNIGTLPTISNTHFYGNYLDSMQGHAYGGAIYTTKALEITGSVKPTLDSVTVISGKASDITSSTNNYSSFIGNYVYARHTASATYVYGGAIWSNANLTISNVLFANNSARFTQAAYGGAIYSIGGTLNLKDSVFVGNASMGSLGDGQGGAIFAGGTIGTITGNIFTGNYISFRTPVDNLFTIENSVTDSTKSESISSSGVNIGTLTYTSHTVSGFKVSTPLMTNDVNVLNTAITTIKSLSNWGNGGYGGALRLSCSSKEISKNTFFANFVYGGYYGAGGAAISNVSTATLLKNNSFEGNFVISRNMTNPSYPTTGGGAIYNQGTIATLAGDLGANKSIFNANGVILYQTVSNEVTAAGGAIYNTGTIGKIINTDFTNNYVVGSATTKAT
ncbi:TPA: hypothetical protein CPT80_05060, partial [Candidatus Gastranaerophilales bacterium HUM_9]